MRKQLLVPALTALLVLPAVYLQAQTADEIVERSLTAQGGRTYDVLDARKVRGGQTFRAYFDVTELFAEETRGLSEALGAAKPR